MCIRDSNNTASGPNENNLHIYRIEKTCKRTILDYNWTLYIDQPNPANREITIQFPFSLFENMLIELGVGGASHRQTSVGPDKF